MGLFALLGWPWSVIAADISELSADRAAIERVYHAHRQGTKPVFEQAMPAALIEKLVRQDLQKEAILLKTYGVAITPAMVEAEVVRINTTTRAPEILAEIQQVLGGDPGRFGRSMARPIIVERELRHRFDNDDALHAALRQAAERARARLRNGQPVENMQEVTWELAPRPGEDDAVSPAATTPVAVNASSSAYSVKGTVQIAQVLGTPNAAGPGNHKLYFDDLDPELQNVLRAQLQKPGDVSAVIEAPGGFLVFLAKARSVERLTAASLSLRKRSYEEWLAGQPEAMP